MPWRRNSLLSDVRILLETDFTELSLDRTKGKQSALCILHYYELEGLISGDVKLQNVSHAGGLKCRTKWNYAMVNRIFA